MGVWIGMKRGDLFMLPHSQCMAETWAQRGKGYFFKTPRELVKRPFVEITKNKRMKMQKTSHFKPVKAGSNTLKRGPCAPHTACELASAHCDTTLRFLNVPEPGLNTDALCLLLERMLSRLIYCT